MNEKWISQKIRKGFKKIRLWSFEACALPNVPDFMAAVQGYSFWLENKCVDSSNCLIPFRKGQPAWIEGYEKENGTVFILVLDRKTSCLHLLAARGRIRELAELKLIDAWGAGFGRGTFDVRRKDWLPNLERSLIASANFRSTQAPL